jgi:tRNA-binding protein
MENNLSDRQAGDSTTPLSWLDFMKVEMRVGTVIAAEVFAEAKNPAYKLIVDFGDFGTRKTSAQITQLYQPEELVGKQVIAVVNFPPKQIANIQSECLVLGAVGTDKEVTLLQPERPVANGTRIA